MTEQTVGTDTRVGLWRSMLRIRRFEERLLKLFREGELRGTAHVCLGQEAVAAGVCAALGHDDYVTSNHRGHGHMIARGASLNRIMAELFGRSDGYALGRGGSQHIADHTIGFLGSNGITAGGLPVAVGAGLSLKLRRIAGVSCAFFGDGATAQGAFHEAMNLAAVRSLPVLFVCENNGYAMGTPVRATCATDSIAQRAHGYGMPSKVVDGNDAEAVLAAAEDLRNEILGGGGPRFLEAKTYRIAGHSRSDACGYRDEAEVRVWRERDPLDLLRARLLEDGLPMDALAALEQEVDEEIERAVAFARQSPPLPVEKVDAYVLPAEATWRAPAAPLTDVARETTYAEALRAAMARALADERVVLLGEDIAGYRGAFRVTGDLCERFPQRVLDTPISENGIVGAGVGAALTGLRPVVEIMFMDFLLLALDQVVNHAAKFGFIAGGQASVPLVVRTPAGGRRGYGATHSQCFESLLMGVPGLKVFNPATVQDAYDLLLAAIADDGPVVVVEHKLLYGAKGNLDPNATPLPPGKARVVRSGRDLTIVTFSHMVGVCCQAAELLAGQGVEAEVIDLRTLAPLDLATLSESACRTQRVLVAEEGVRDNGVGAEIAALLQEACFGYLDAPILRVGARRIPVPTAAHLEEAVLPGVADVARAAAALLQ